MGEQKNTVLIIAVCMGIFSFFAELIISKYGPEWLVMGIGLFSLALIAVSLMLLWKSMAESEVEAPPEIENISEEEADQASVMAPIENVDIVQEAPVVQEPKSPEAQNMEF